MRVSTAGMALCHLQSPAAAPGAALQRMECPVLPRGVTV